MVNTITNSIDIWVTAQSRKSKGRGRSVANQSMYGVQKLRELILELAVIGKLLPQDPTDEPASDLLKKIAKEKGLLVKEGKIKEQKQLHEISENEKTFNLPIGWSWVRFGSISEIERGGSPRPINSYLTDDPNGLNWIKIGDTEKGGKYITSTNEKIRREGLTKTRMVYPGDFLLTNSMSFGRPYITKIEGCIHDGWLRIHPPSALEKDYLYQLLSSPYVAKLFKKSAAGAVVLNLNADKVRELLIPLPPLAEQHRIVAKVDELMALCDQLEQQQTARNAAHETLVNTFLSTLTNVTDQTEFEEAWERISKNFDILFTSEQSIDQLKQTLLQLAVMGKLVPQNPEDEPASALLEKIEKEKERLVKEGKIKPQKPLPEIGEDEKPFSLPLGWAWARFPQIGEFGRGKSKHRPRNDASLYSDGKYPMIQTGDVARSDGIVKTYTALYNENGLAQSRMWPQGTLCITIAANIADTAILGFDACFPDSVVGLISSKGNSNTKYFEYFMRTAKENLTAFAPSTAQKNINLGILETVFIPLPPLNEQHLIVNKVDELFTLCDSLKQNIVDAQTTKIQLADTIVEQAIS